MNCKNCQKYYPSQKNFHLCSYVCVIDATHHPIGGKEYYEYLAVDTGQGILHRYLRPGRECTYGYRKLLEELEEAGYIPDAIVSDGGTGIASTVRYFDFKVHQRCHVHIMRDMRRGFRMPKKRMKQTLRKYYIYKYAKLVLDARTEKQKQARWKHFERVVLKMWSPQGDGEKNVVKAFVRAMPNAFTFMKYELQYTIPTTSNRVEGHISNLNTRLKTMRGMKNSNNAELLLNGIHYYLVKR